MDEILDGGEVNSVELGGVEVDGGVQVAEVCERCDGLSRKGVARAVVLDVRADVVWFRHEVYALIGGWEEDGDGWDVEVEREVKVGLPYGIVVLRNCAGVEVDSDKCEACHRIG